MKRYLVFCGAHYYPCGGWCDFHAAFDSLDEAQNAIISIKNKGGFDRCEWIQIVDLQTMEIIEEH